MIRQTRMSMWKYGFHQRWERVLVDSPQKTARVPVDKIHIVSGVFFCVWIYLYIYGLYWCTTMGRFYLPAEFILPHTPINTLNMYILCTARKNVLVANIYDFVTKTWNENVKAHNIKYAVICVYTNVVIGMSYCSMYQSEYFFLNGKYMQNRMSDFNEHNTLAVW